MPPRWTPAGVTASTEAAEPLLHLLAVKRRLLQDPRSLPLVPEQPAPLRLSIAGIPCSPAPPLRIPPPLAHPTAPRCRGRPRPAPPTCRLRAGRRSGGRARRPPRD